MTHKKKHTFRIFSLILSVLLIIGLFPMTVSAAGCENCGSDSGYTVSYEYWTSSYHSVRHWCNNCGKDQTMGGAADAHSYSHSDSGYDVCVCGHTVACACGGEVGGGESSCSHSSSYTEWFGCEWYAYCSSCNDYMGSGVTHGEYEYGAWELYDWQTHRHLYACTRCGEGDYEYEEHNYSYGEWEYADFDRHGKYCYCTVCGYDSTVYEPHDCSYRYFWDSEYDHVKVSECFCGHYYDELEQHRDTNGDGKCDMCGYMNKRFSVTVPAFLTLTVSEDGTVYAAVTAMIFNNSTGEIAVTDITLSAENGWTIVPFDTNMANEKVNTKLIGFRINGSESTTDGDSEDLTLNEEWNIAADSMLTLDYGAVVSALSEPIDEQVLTVVFIVGWAV